MAEPKRARATLTIYDVASRAGVSIAAALALTQTMASLLYGVRPHDPTVFLVVPLLLLAHALQLFVDLLRGIFRKGVLAIHLQKEGSIRPGLELLS